MLRSRRGVCVSVGVLLMCAGLPASADNAVGPGIIEARPGVLNLRTGDVTLANQTDLLTQAGAAFAAGERYVVTLVGPMTPEREAALRGAGVRIGQYLPTDSFVCELSASTPAALRGLGFVAGVTAYQNAWKLDPAIGSLVPASPERVALANEGMLALVVYLHDAEPLNPTQQLIEAMPGAAVVGSALVGQAREIRVALPRESVARLAELPGVKFVEEFPELTLRSNTLNRWVVQSTTQSFTPLYANGLRGEGQILGHVDGRLGVNHCSFIDPQGDPVGPNHRKVQAYNVTLGYDFHGTHTGGTAVGEALDAQGNTVFSDATGVAHKARLVFSTIPSFSETAFGNMLSLHASQGATVHTNSWGNDGTVAYDGLCRAIDNFMWTNQDQLVLFAVTNTSLLKNPENAKNVLAVGASQNFPNFNNFCSGGAGPTNDGRRKPEVFAPGCSTQSSSGSTGCATSAATGTSMACPAVAGAGLLVREYFVDGFYPSGSARSVDSFVPSGALIKGVLVNSAVDMTGIAGYPSNGEGWGRIAVDNALFFSADTRKLIVKDVRNGSTPALTTGGSTTYTFNVGQAAQNLRVTLVFTDAPAAVNATSAAINNLNLTVTTPGNQTFLGNVFSGGFSATGGTADPRNNIEQVHIAAPAAGTYTVRIDAPAVQVGRQGFALVVTGDVSEAPICRADLNGDGTPDVVDFFLFLDFYSRGDLRADFDNNNVVTGDDFFGFLSALSSGC